MSLVVRGNPSRFRTARSSPAGRDAIPGTCVAFFINCGRWMTQVHSDRAALFREPVDLRGSAGDPGKGFSGVIGTTGEAIDLATSSSGPQGWRMSRRAGNHQSIRLSLLHDRRAGFRRAPNTPRHEHRYLATWPPAPPMADLAVNPDSMAAKGCLAPDPSHTPTICLASGESGHVILAVNKIDSSVSTRPVFEPDRLSDFTTFAAKLSFFIDHPGFRSRHAWHNVGGSLGQYGMVYRRYVAAHA